jgi:hypothetical protein
MKNERGEEKGQAVNPPSKYGIIIQGTAIWNHAG